MLLLEYLHKLYTRDVGHTNPNGLAGVHHEE